MTTIDIRHRVGIDAPQDQVHHALATIDGLSTWWTTDTRGDPHEGGKVAFSFGGPDAAMTADVVEAGPSRVAWRVVEGPAEWLDTLISFDLAHADGETTLTFAHAGWREAVPFLAHCSTKWAYFLIGLKLLLEGGATSPYPDDLKISSWG